MLLFCILTVLILTPLAHGIAWGVIFAFVWHPLHNRIGRSSFLHRNPNLQTTVSLLLLLITVTIPLVLTTNAMLSEFVSAYANLTSYISEMRTKDLPPISSLLPPYIADLVTPILADQSKIAEGLSRLAQSAASLLQNLSKGLISWTGSFLFQSFIALMTMFFCIRDGGTMVSYIKDFVPLERSEREEFMAKTATIMNSVIYGVIMTVGIQAVLGGIGWWAAGLSNAFLAAAAMFLFGMFPMGTAAVWLPGSIYLMMTGAVGWGIALLIWGFVVVSSIDNVVRPIFIGGGSIPTLAIILGLSGGIAVWGFLGVFLGPLSIALFLSVLELYRSRIIALGDIRPHRPQ